MLLIPNINFQGNLSLDAFSFNSEEIDAVTSVLNKSNIKISTLELPKDKSGRFGIRFSVPAREISKLERTLNIKFEGSGEDTGVEMSGIFSNLTGERPSTYKCNRIDPPPTACKTIYADDDKEAVVLCGLVAHDNNWLGGDAKPGNCDSRSQPFIQTDQSNVEHSRLIHQSQESVKRYQ